MFTRFRNKHHCSGVVSIYMYLDGRHSGKRYTLVRVAKGNFTKTGQNPYSNQAISIISEHYSPTPLPYQDVKAGKLVYHILIQYPVLDSHLDAVNYIISFIYIKITSFLSLCLLQWSFCQSHLHSTVTTWKTTGYLISLYCYQKNRQGTKHEKLRLPIFPATLEQTQKVHVLN